MNVPLPQKQKKFSLKKFLKKLPWRAIFSLLLSFAAAAFGVYLGYRDVSISHYCQIGYCYSRFNCTIPI